MRRRRVMMKRMRGMRMGRMMVVMRRRMVMGRRKRGWWC